MLARGQKPVNEAWNMLRPTKTGSASHAMWCVNASTAPAVHHHRARTSALLPVHFAGLSGPMNEIQAIAEQHSLKIQWHLADLVEKQGSPLRQL